MNKLIVHIFFSILIAIMSACNFNVDKTKLPKTKIKFIDSVRHYFPVPQGKKLTIPYKFINVGEHPLTIIEVQTSCGCTLAKFPDRLIENEGEGIIELEFNSTKNIGYTEVYVTVFANTEPIMMHTLIFDLNVVPDAHYTKDYEEIFDEEEIKDKDGTKKLVDGDETEQGYYIDSTEARKF